MKNQGTALKKTDISFEQLSEKAVKVLAGSIYRRLQAEGCMPRDIISVSSQLLSLVTNQLETETAIKTP